MSAILEQIAVCVERGKINKASPYPGELKGQDGVDELTKRALGDGVNPQDLLTHGLIVGMQRIGVKFRDNKVFMPDVLLAARAMHTAMRQLKPFFQSGEVKRKGTFVIGTVFGDLHDIGKNLVSMMIEGLGWEVIDLGVDVKIEKFLESVETHKGCLLGLSALLTTTMANMGKTVRAVKEKYPSVKILVGGAPLTLDFATSIGADCYSSDPQGAIDYLNSLKA